MPLKKERKKERKRRCSDKNNFKKTNVESKNNLFHEIVWFNISVYCNLTSIKSSCLKLITHTYQTQDQI